MATLPPLSLRIDRSLFFPNLSVFFLYSSFIFLDSFITLCCLLASFLVDKRILSVCCIRLPGQTCVVRARAGVVCVVFRGMSSCLVGVSFTRMNLLSTLATCLACSLLDRVSFFWWNILTTTSKSLTSLINHFKVANCSQRKSIYR